MLALGRRPSRGKDHVELHMTPGEALALARYLDGHQDTAALQAATDAVQALARVPDGEMKPQER